MSSISSLNSTTPSSYASVGHHRRRDPAKMADELFSKLDTKGQGYLEKSDLESALSAVGSASGSSSGSASAADVFSALDSNGDGKVTKDEMSSSLQKLAEQLNGQFNQSRMSGAMGGPGGHHGGDGDGDQDGGQDQGLTKDQISSLASATDDSKLSQMMNSLASNFDAADTNGDGKITRDEARAYQESTTTSSTNSTGAAGGMPPPPPGGGDQGMTVDQMKSVASSTTDSKLADLLNSVSSNFDAADANGDGKVTAQEAMAYQQSQQSDSSGSSSSNSNSSSSTSSEAAVMKRIMDLVHAYGNGGNNSGFSQLLGSLSTSA